MNNEQGAITKHFLKVRQQFEDLCSNLEIDDYGLQSMTEASPPKWHLAHVTWFFETFILKPFDRSYRTPNSKYEMLFNSYYNGVGTQYPRNKRHLLSRPTVAEVYDYRKQVDEHIIGLLENPSHPDFHHIVQLVTLGIHHEQQHQELFLTDLKHHFFQNPLYPEYNDSLHSSRQTVKPLDFFEFDGGLVEQGFKGEGFHFDNERPHHQCFLYPFAIANRLITNSEYLEFIEDGGYNQSALWLSDGWSTIRQQHWQHPLYWTQIEGDWFEFTLNGLQPLELNDPVCHVSFYEADAFARWSNKRLPTESEWERVAREVPLEGHFMEEKHFHPRQDQHPTADYPSQMFGDTWEWTQSSYASYPGYHPTSGAIGEYNGKFMCNQMVLRGGSCATPSDHIRTTYRNFFYPDQRWQFMGIRLAQDLT